MSQVTFRCQLPWRRKEKHPSVINNQLVYIAASARSFLTTSVGWYQPGLAFICGRNSQWMRSHIVKVWEMFSAHHAHMRRPLWSCSLCTEWWIFNLHSYWQNASVWWHVRPNGPLLRATRHWLNWPGLPNIFIRNLRYHIVSCSLVSVLLTTSLRPWTHHHYIHTRTRTWKAASVTQEYWFVPRQVSRKSLKLNH